MDERDYHIPAEAAAAKCGHRSLELVMPNEGYRANICLCLNCGCFVLMMRSIRLRWTLAYSQANQLVGE